MKNHTKPLIELFEDNELHISQLYKLYSQKIAGHKLFWAKLSNEELGHAADIRKLYKTSKIEFTENNFTRGAVNYVITFVEEEIRKTRAGKISHFDALNIALRVEQSILEKKCFDFFSPTNLNLKDVMEKFNKEVDRHIKILQKELKQQK